MHIFTPAKFLLFSALVTGAIHASAQPTALVAGDLAFTGYNSSDNTVNSVNSSPADDDICFVLLKDINAGTEIFFTDFGWHSSTPQGAFQKPWPCSAQQYPVGSGSVTDGILKWTATANMTYGTQVLIRTRISPFASQGTITTTQASYNLNSGQPQYMSLPSSDQVFAYQGTRDNPTLIAGLNTVATSSVLTGWSTSLDSCLFTASWSVRPAALDTGNCAPALLPGNGLANFRLKPNVTIPFPASAARAVIANTANWESTTTGAANAFAFPASNPVSLPITLTSFSARRADAAAVLSWQVGREDATAGYTVEHSADGIQYKALGQVPATGRPGYTFPAPQPQPGANYYRLRIGERDGSSSYSNTARLDGGVAGTGTTATISPNPARDVLILRTPAAGRATATILSMTGAVLSQHAVREAETALSLADLPTGMYLLRYADAASVQTFSFAKQ